MIALAALGVANLPNLLDRKGVQTGGGGGQTRGGIQSMLGVELDQLKVTKVTEGSVAAKAGLQAGDVLEKLGATKLEAARDIFTAMRESEAPWTLAVKRGVEVVTMKLERPPAPASRPAGATESRSGASSLIR